MFERIVEEKIEIEKSIIRDLIDSVTDNKSITRIQILNSKLSDFTKNYLLYEFNEQSKAEDLYEKVAKANKLFFNYTMRPRWTLQTFLFSNFESRPPGEIIKKLNLFTFYNFYSDAIKDFIADNSPIFMTKQEVTSLIDQTNKAIYNKLTNEINNAKIKNFLLQIFLLKYGIESNYNLESTIPYSFIKIFLEDKSFSELENKFNVVKGLKGESEISLKDVIKVLTDKYNLQGKPVKDDSDIESQIIVSENHRIKIAHDKAELKEKDIEIVEVKNRTKTDIKPTVKDNYGVTKTDVKNQKIKEEDIQITGANKKKVHEKIYSEDLAKANEKTEVNSETKVEDKSSEEKYELKDLFSENQLDKILSRIYKSDLIYQDKSFNKLNTFKTWREASNHLKDIFKINGVDLYNKDVISFVNILNDYYKNKE